jgi:hypothetical protein
MKKNAFFAEFLALFIEFSVKKIQKSHNYLKIEIQ